MVPVPCLMCYLCPPSAKNGPEVVPVPCLMFYLCPPPAKGRPEPVRVHALFGARLPQHAPAAEEERQEKKQETQQTESRSQNYVTTLACG